MSRVKTGCDGDKVKRGGGGVPGTPRSGMEAEESGSRGHKPERDTQDEDPALTAPAQLKKAFGHRMG